MQNLLLPALCLGRPLTTLNLISSGRIETLEKSIK